MSKFEDRLGKYLERRQGQITLPRSAFKMRKISYQCFYHKVKEEKGSPLIRYEFFDCLPLYKKEVHDKWCEIKSKTIKVLFPAILDRIAPPTVANIDRLLEKQKVSHTDWVDELFQRLDEGDLDMECVAVYSSEDYEACHREFITEFFFIPNMNDRYSVNGKLIHEEIYEHLSPEELKERLVQEEIYKKMKQVIGNSVFMRFNKEHTKIIGGPF